MCIPIFLFSTESPSEESKRESLIDSKLEEHEESLESACSSPEQETVRPKKSSLTCTRGPHVQDLFSRGSESTTIAIIEPKANSLNDETEPESTRDADTIVSAEPKNI